MGLALAHPEEASLDDLQGLGFQVDQNTQQPILRGRQGTVPVGGVPAGRAWLPIEAPLGHMGLERGLKGRHQLPQLVHGETGQIQDLQRAGPEIGEPSSAHGCGLLPLEAEHTINRDELY